MSVSSRPSLVSLCQFCSQEMNSRSNSVAFLEASNACSNFLDKASRVFPQNEGIH